MSDDKNIIQPGNRIGNHYLVEKIIGQGGMGHVYKAVHDLTAQVVAIKTLSPHLATDPGLRERFLQEARALAAFDHPNLMTLHTFIEQDSQLFLVMQFIDGQDLDAMFRRCRGLSVRASVPIIAQALDGLSYAHDRGVIHRDLKPANIMVTRDGRVKLTDFGIARVSGELRLTVAGAQVGTVFYMAPEQIQGSIAEPRTDIYAMGVCLYEVLTARLPFEGDDYRVRKGHVEELPPDPRTHKPDIPPYLVDVLYRALAKRPEDRYQTADEFRQALPDLGEPLPLASCYRCGILYPEGAGMEYSPPQADRTPGPPQDVCQRCFRKISAHPTLQDHPLVSLKGYKEYQARQRANSQSPQIAYSNPGTHSPHSSHSSLPAASNAPASQAPPPSKYPEELVSTNNDYTSSNEHVVAPSSAHLAAPLSQPPSQAPLSFEQQTPSEAHHAVSSLQGPTTNSWTFPHTPPSTLLTRDGAEMVLIQEGQFILGHNNTEADARPARELFLGPYYIDRYPVTNERYLLFIEEQGYSRPKHWWDPQKHNGQSFPPERAQHPVTNVSFQDALEYCNWAGKRLPTEAEWEKVARFTDGRPFPWGTDWQENHANFGSNQTTPVHQYPQGQSPYGAIDLLGNAWEWVSDWYAKNSYSNMNEYNPAGPMQGKYKVIRGGSHADPNSSVYGHTRGYRTPNLPSAVLGFRCVLEIHLDAPQEPPNSSHK